MVNDPAMDEPAAQQPPSPAPADRPKLAGWLPMALGVLALVLGALWTLQGLDVITDSQMSDVQIWAVIGPVVAVAGLILIILGVRIRTRHKKANW